MAYLSFAGSVRCTTLLSTCCKPLMVKRTISRASHQFHRSGAGVLQTHRTTHTTTRRPGHRRRSKLFTEPWTTEDQNILLAVLAVSITTAVVAATYYGNGWSDGEIRQDLAASKANAASLRQALVDYEFHALASSYLDEVTVAELQRDIHAVLSADSAIMTEIGANLKIHRPYTADIRPPLAQLRFPYSSNSTRGSVLAMIFVPGDYDQPPEKGILMSPEEFRDAVASPVRYCPDVQVSETVRLMASRSRVAVLLVDLGEAQIHLYHNCNVECETLLQHLKMSKRDDPPEGSKGSKFAQNLEQIEVPADSDKRSAAT